MDRKGPPAICGLAQCEDARGAFGARNGGRCSLAALVCGVVCCLAWGLRPVRHTPSVGPAVPVPFAAPYHHNKEPPHTQPAEVTWNGVLMGTWESEKWWG